MNRTSVNCLAVGVRRILQGILVLAFAPIGVALAEAQPISHLIDEYTQISNDAGDIVPASSAAGVCSTELCCNQRALLFRDSIAPWYQKQSDFQQSIRAIEDKLRAEPIGLQSPRLGILMNLDQAQVDLYLAVATMATECDPVVAKCQVGAARRFFHAALLYNKGEIETAQNAADAAAEYAARCGTAKDKCGCR